MNLYFNLNVCSHGKIISDLLFQGLAGELVNVLREAGQIVPASLTKFGTHVKKKVCT